MLLFLVCKGNMGTMDCIFLIASNQFFSDGKIITPMHPGECMRFM